jgi:L-aspartate oxidase
MCGGVTTDLDGQTSVQRLFAFGEVACTGVHGANRLASNSLLEALVFSERAYRKIISSGMKLISLTDSEKREIHDIPNAKREADVNEVAFLRKDIQKTCWNDCGIIRHLDKLKHAFSLLSDIENWSRSIFKHTRKTRQTIELYNMAIVARLIVEAAINRTQSVGAHYVEDKMPVAS